MSRRLAFATVCCGAQEVALLRSRQVRILKRHSPCRPSPLGAILISMIAKVDREGRIVVPKKLREKLGLRAGMEIEVAETSDGLTLKPVTKKSSLTREGRFLVHTGKPIHGYSVSDAVHEDREARLRKLARL